MNQFTAKFATPDRHFKFDIDDDNIRTNLNLSDNHIHDMIDFGDASYEMSQHPNIKKSHIDKMLKNSPHTASYIVDNLLKNPAVPFHAAKNIYNGLRSYQKHHALEHIAGRHDMDHETADELTKKCEGDSIEPGLDSRHASNILSENPAIKGEHLQRLVDRKYPSADVINNPNLTSQQLRTLLPKFSVPELHQRILEHPNADHQLMQEIIDKHSVGEEAPRFHLSLSKTKKQLAPIHISTLMKKSQENYDSRGLSSNPVWSNIATRHDLTDEHVNELLKSPSPSVKMALLRNKSVQHHPDIQKAKNDQ